jgi:xanthine dehydrogenase accessory factor
VRFDELVVLRGGGDLATGVAYRLHHAGFPVVVCELAGPLTVRRTVALSSAVAAGEVTVEGVVGRQASVDERALARRGDRCSFRPVFLVSMPMRGRRMAKRNIDSTIHAAIVVGLGPGSYRRVATPWSGRRGPHLGRVRGRPCQPNTGVPGVMAVGTERVLRAPTDGGVVKVDFDMAPS